METSLRDGSVRALVSERPQLGLQRQAIELGERQAEEQPDAGGDLRAESPVQMKSTS
jgi:hypothetical protein